MNKAIRIAQLSAKGSFTLFLGHAVSRVVSALGTILLVRLLTPPEYGLVTIALIAPVLISLFRDWGLSSSMIKYLAQYRSEGKTKEIKNILTSGLLFESTLGILLAIISYLLAGFLTTNVFHRPEIRSPIEITSLIILAGSLITLSQSTFIGFERMEFLSLTMICQNSIRAFLAPLLVFLGYGVFGAVLGTTVAFIVAGAIGIIIFYLVFYNKTCTTDNPRFNFGGTLRNMLRYGLPLSVPFILLGLLPQFYNFMIAIYCSDSIIGNYQASVSFTMLIAFFTIPIETALFPTFSKLNSKREMKTLKTVFQSSVKYASLLTIPVTAAVIVLSKPLVFTLFGEQYEFAPLFLSLYAVTYLYIGVGNLSLVNFLNGQGKTKVTMQLSLINLATALPLSFILIPKYGILGLIFTMLFSAIPSLTFGLWWIKKHFDVTVDLTSSARIYMASALSAVITYFILSQLAFEYWIELLIGGSFFFTAYFITAPFIGAVNLSDIANLRQMLSDLGPFTPLFNILFNIIERIIVR